MYLGRIAELAPSGELYARPLHPYTQALLASAPVADPDAPLRPPALAGDVPSALDAPPGCRFASRCPMVMGVCRQVDPVRSKSAGALGGLPPVSRFHLQRRANDRGRWLNTDELMVLEHQPRNPAPGPGLASIRRSQPRTAAKGMQWLISPSEHLARLRR